MNEQIERTLLHYVAAHPGNPLKRRALARALNIADQDYHEFKQLLDRLINAGRLALGRGRGLVIPEASTAELVGVLHIDRRGFGFVDIPGRSSVFIPPGYLGDANHGDTVAARMMEGRRAGDDRARVVRVVRAAVTRWVGPLERMGDRWIVRPQGDGPIAIVDVDDPGAKSARAGDLVVVEPLHILTDVGRGRGVIVERLGNASETRTMILGVVRRYGLPTEFSHDVRDAARRAAHKLEVETRRLPADREQSNPAAEQGHHRRHQPVQGASHKSERERAHALVGTDAEPQSVAVREDIRHLLTITIDPVDARDFDDAITIQHLPAGVTRLGVHIADVAFFVEPDGPIDREARQRGTSVYFPGFVVPMLPETLSNGVCSLQEGQPRLTKSAFIDYDPHAQIVATRFANTVIRSDCRLTYERVTDALEGRSDGISAEVLALLESAEQLARRIRKRRVEAGMISLNLPETEIVLGVDEQLADVRPADTSFSHTIIEMFMVEANEAVCRMLARLDLPHLRRVHPAPDPEALLKLSKQLAAIGTPALNGPTHADIQRLLNYVHKKPEEQPVNYLLLRSMAQALYSPRREGHFALASDDYTHFTSPIRRYPDLTIHRLFDYCIARGFGTSDSDSPHISLQDRQLRDSRHTGGMAIPGDQPDVVRRRRSKSNPDEHGVRHDLDTTIPSEADLVHLGFLCSAAERRAQEAERDARTLLILEFMKSKIGEAFDGIVSGISSVGAFVRIFPYLAEGLVRTSDLGDDDWMYNRDNSTLVGRHSRRVIAVGQRVRVQLVGISQLRQEMELAPVSPFGVTGHSRPGASHGQSADQGRRPRESRSHPRQRDHAVPGPTSRHASKKGASRSGRAAKPMLRAENNPGVRRKRRRKR